MNSVILNTSGKIMLFDRENYISENEKKILAGGVYYKYWFDEKKTCKFLLTDKKAIWAGEDYLEIVLLNKIDAIRYDSHTSDGTTITWIALFYGGKESRIYLASNPEWGNEIIQEISKRLG